MVCFNPSRRCKIKEPLPEWEGFGKMCCPRLLHKGNVATIWTKSHVQVYVIVECDAIIVLIIVTSHFYTDIAL